MTGRFSKRGKNPAAADCWLDSLGYYRKNVAYDETCLFRAVSEQLFNTQINHEDVRKKCIRYGKDHFKDFQYLVPCKKDWFDRLKKLAIHMVVCSDIEIKLVCDAYQVDITVFKAASHETREFRSHNLCKGTQMLLLCSMGEDHYDAVYTKEHIATAGFCQSIVYNVLYEKVFRIIDVESIVHSMLHDKQAPYTVYCPETKMIKKENLEEDELMDDDSMLELTLRQQNMLAPFPFKIAKALDPNMYRNIEYDTWLELRREMRLGEWYYGDDRLILGTRCILALDNQDYQCYIQNILKKDKTKCEVYITKLAERRTVNYRDLRPEDDAKPWPLPYRFARNQPLPLSGGMASDNDRKILRKRREKKHLQLTEENPQAGKQDDVNVSSYEGYPLHMQDTVDVDSLEHLSTVIQLSTCSPEPNSDQNEVVHTAPDSMVWDHAFIASHDVYYNTDMQSSDAINCQGHNAEQVMYSYSPETTYPAISMWSTHPQYMLSPNSALSGDDTPSPVDQNENFQKYVYYAADNAYSSPSYPPQSPLPSATPLSFAPFPASFADRTMCSAPASPANPQVDMYPIMMPSPGTPVYYAHPPPAISSPMPRPEYIVPNASPLPICSPPLLEMQYVCSPCIYPSTPSMAWYNHPHPHVNAQGFVFPMQSNSNPNIAQSPNVHNYS